jgi:tetraacyldisaccharide 4'-kinase
VLYNAGRASTALPGHLARRELTGLVTLADWWAGCAPTSGVPAELQNHTVLASAGIGQPMRFFDALRALGLAIDPWPLPDHDRLDPLPWPASTTDVVVTEKDAVKLPLARVQAERPGLRVWVAPLTFTLPPDFVDAVRARLPNPPRRD